MLRLRKLSPLGEAPHSSRSEAGHGHWTGSSPSRTELWGIVPICVLVVGCPLAGGSVDWRAQLAASVLASLAVFFAARQGSTGLPILVVGLLVVTAVTVLQLVPLPPFLVRLLSPKSAATLDSALRPLGLYPAPRALSLDPPATALEAAKALTCTAAVAATAMVAASRRARKLLLAALPLSGLAVVSLGLLHALATGTDGFESKFAFVNPNHLAGFLNLVAWPALGLGLQATGRKRLLWLGCFSATASGVFLSLSRGGIGAFFGGLGVFSILHLRASRRGPRSDPWRLAIASVAIAAALGIAAFLGLQRVLTEIQTVPLMHLSSYDKIALWPLLTRMIRSFPLTGIGRGAFDTVFPVFKVDADPFTWTHPENEWLQPLVDLGIPAGALLVASFGWTWVRAAAGRELSQTEAGALAGAAALLLQNLVDFSLEILGVAVPFAVAMALISKPGPRLRVSQRALSIAAVCCLLGSVSGTLFYRAHSAEADARRVARAENLDQMKALAKSAAHWHPADYFPRAVVGIQLAAQGHCSEALPWLFQAMALHPTTPDPHYFAASCLAAAKQDALAKREYRLAYLFGRRDSLETAFRWFPATSDMLKVAPESAEGLLSVGGLLADQRRLEDAKSIFERAWTDYGDLTALARLADVALALGQPQEAIRWSLMLRELDPRWLSSYTVSSNAFLKLDNLDAACHELELGATQLPGNPDIAESHANLLFQQNRFAEARRVLGTALPRNAHEVAQLHRMIGATLQREGRTLEAIAELEAARDALPADVAIRVELSELLAGAGRFNEAIDALQTLASLPETPKGAFDARIAELTAQRQRQLVLMDAVPRPAPTKDDLR